MIALNKRNEIECQIKLPWSFNPFLPRILSKIGIFLKKPATLNACISKARANSESKLTFWESSFNLLQKSLLLGSAPYNPWGRCQRLSGLRVIDEPVRVLNLLFFCLFHMEMRKNFRKTAFFHFWFLPRILWKIGI